MYVICKNKYFGGNQIYNKQLTAVIVINHYNTAPNTMESSKYESNQISLFLKTTKNYLFPTIFKWKLTIS